MVAVMIGIDPHEASHTAVAIDPAEVPLGQLQVRACAAQAERLLGWAQARPQRTWAVEGAGGVGHLPDWQLLAAGERVLDVPPRLAARVRLLATGNINKNDPSDARSVAVAALRCERAAGHMGGGGGWCMGCRRPWPVREVGRGDLERV
jgi:transposase